MNKDVYTKLFLKELGEDYRDEALVKHYIPLWWQNIRQKEKGGLGLTDLGLEVVKKIGLETYYVPYPYDMPLNSQVMVHLDNFIDCPYHFDRKGITVTNSRKGVELALFSGDIRKYGIAKALARTRIENSQAH